jgi:hypothetical protein
MTLNTKHVAIWQPRSRANTLMQCAARILEAVLLATLLAVLSSMPEPAFAAQSWPEVAMPPKAEVQWVAASMRVNGVPTRVLQFQSRASRTEVVEYYRSYWSNGYEHEPTVRPMGPRATVLGQLHGPYLLTVKVEDGDKGTSRGLISLAQIGGSALDRSPGVVPLMPGAHVVSVVESDDPGKRSRQVVIYTSQPAASATRFYQASFANAGWLQLQGAPSPTASRRASPSSFLVFARGPSEMQVSIAEMDKGKGSAVLTNLVTKDTGPAAR